jgi:hypothetical protein
LAGGGGKVTFPLIQNCPTGTSSATCVISAFWSGRVHCNRPTTISMVPK